jgi:hypothetical protein
VPLRQIGQALPQGVAQSGFCLWLSSEPVWWFASRLIVPG